MSEKREELAKAIQLEREERAKRCMDKIQAVLVEEHCQLISRVDLEEIAPGRFGITSKPGVKPE